MKPPIWANEHLARDVRFRTAEISLSMTGTGATRTSPLGRYQTVRFALNDGERQTILNATEGGRCRQNLKSWMGTAHFLTQTL
jgi:hypothetical protein